jgi:hypothetical protein
MRVVPFLLCAFLLLTATAFAQTTTLSAQTSNNTAACAAAGSPSYCKAGWSGLSDSVSGAYDPVPGNVSSASIRPLLYSGNTTMLFTYLMPWFCMSSSGTGLGTLCNNHLQVGYNSNDSGTVNGQASDMIRRGFQGVVIDWYGPTLGFPYDQVSQKFRDNLNRRCGGPQSCPLLLALMEDQGSFQWSGGPNGAGCPQNGGGVDQTNCILSKLQSDMDYMNQNYFNTNSYLRVDNTPGSSTYMQATPSGKPTVLFFICEECWTNPSPDWTTIWNSLRTYTNRYSSGGIAMFFIFRNAPAFSHVQTNGGFAWVNWYGTDPYGLNYLANFYSTATSAVNQNPSLLAFGGGWKGFDDTNAPWVSGDSRIIGQQCGNTWLQTIQKANSYYSGSKQLPFFGAVTWNDYEEGSEIETGIDNCLTLSAAVTGQSVLQWNLNFSPSSGSENTVAGYTIYKSTNPNNLTVLTTVPPGTHSIDLNSFVLPSGNYTFYVQAVGQPSIMNKMSKGVKYRVK